MNISQKLDEIEQVADAATEGPWEARPAGQGGRVHEPDGHPLPGCFNCGENDDAIYELADATFIADARTTVPTLVDALRVVLKRHQPVEVWEIDPANGTWVRDAAGEVVPAPSVCGECTPDDSLLAIEDGEWSEDYEVVQHPCPTVRDIETTLGGVA